MFVDVYLENESGFSPKLDEVVSSSELYPVVRNNIVLPLVLQHLLYIRIYILFL